MVEKPEVPLVSVIVPTRHRPEYLREALASVAAVRRDDFEIETIVVDDGPSDDTRRVAEEMGVHYVRGGGLGASKARNTGIAVARGEFLGFVDDDDAWTPDNVAPQLRLLHAHPEYVAAVSRFVITDAHLEHPGEAYPREPLDMSDSLKAMLRHIAPTGTVLARSMAIEAIGGFDETLHSAEDWDFSLRLARYGPLGYVDVLGYLARTNPEVRGYTASYHEDVMWIRLRDVRRVFRHHTRHLGWWKRLQVQSAMVARRGWFVAQFLHISVMYRQERRYSRAARTLLMAFLASPPHAFLNLLRTTRRIGSGRTSARMGR